MTCGICGRTEAKPLELADGRTIGAACSDRCSALLWESRALPPETKDEQRILAWRIRRHVASVRGRPFAEPNPVEPELMRAVLDFEALVRLTTEAPEGEPNAVPEF